MPKIAIIEDSVALAQLFCAILEAAGFQVETFGDAESFLATEYWKFDLAVVDLQLPNIHGVGLIREVFHKSGLRCIALSGSDRLTQIQAYAAGAIVALTKPISNRALTLFVRAILELDSWPRT